MTTAVEGWIALSSGSNVEMSWQNAWERASKSIDGATRRRMPGSVPGVEISLLDWGGEGDLVFLHHANGFCAATLAPIANALGDRYRVVAMDARGQGDSTSVEPTGKPNPYAWERLAADLRAAVHGILEITGRDRVELAIGHSFGGALILYAAQSEPALFGSILLCDPVIVEPAQPGVNQSPPRGRDMAAGARKRRDRFPTRAAAFEHFRSRRLFEDFGPEALALYVGEGIGPTSDGDFALKCKPEVEAAVFSSAAASDVLANADKVGADVTFLHAERGNFSRETYNALAGRMPSARVEGLDAGHLFPLEEPERVLAIVDQLTQDRK
jgi:pimeloyl-ACP methyl ester carboxylesterase